MLGLDTLDVIQMKLNCNGAIVDNNTYLWMCGQKAVNHVLR